MTSERDFLLGLIRDLSDDNMKLDLTALGDYARGRLRALERDNTGDATLIAQALLAATANLGCSDGGCRFRVHAQGEMHTNGGCKCLGDGRFPWSFQQHQSAIEAARALVGGKT